jgi:hypothetical protein
LNKDTEEDMVIISFFFLKKINNYKKIGDRDPPIDSVNGKKKILSDIEIGKN